MNPATFHAGRLILNVMLWVNIRACKRMARRALTFRFNKTVQPPTVFVKSQRNQEFVTDLKKYRSVIKRSRKWLQNLHKHLNKNPVLTLNESIQPFYIQMSYALFMGFYLINWLVNLAKWNYVTVGISLGFLFIPSLCRLCVNSEFSSSAKHPKFFTHNISNKFNEKDFGISQKKKKKLENKRKVSNIS